MRQMLKPKLHQTLPTIFTTLLLLLQIDCRAWGARCGAKTPTVQQTQVGFGTPPVFTVSVQNSCPVCPAIDIHVKCGAFPQLLTDPKVLRVVAFDDCVVNAGLPLAPLQKLSFNYTHKRFNLELKSWYFQCE